MDKVNGKLIIFFEEPFWIGLFERNENGRLAVCKVTFGTEPKDYEINEFIERNYFNLKFSPSVDNFKAEKTRMNPKRLRRLVKQETKVNGIGTKSQQALKLQQEQGKQARKKQSREQKEEAKELHFTLKQQKRKQKHRGR